MDWEPSETGQPLGPYGHWENNANIGNERAGGGQMLPVFVRLTVKPGSDMAVFLARLLERRPDIRIPDTELDYLMTLADRTRGGPTDALVQVFCPKELITDEAWTVLHVGPPTDLEDIPATDPEIPPTNPTIVPGTGYLGKVILASDAAIAPIPLVALIDDGIGYLNRRFHKADGTTRFRAIWLQSARRVQSTTNNAFADEVYVGRVLGWADINNQVAHGEAAAYLHQSAELARPAEHKSLIGRRGHGTLVLDLAAGASPETLDPMLEVPLLGVQLPPSALGEVASGRLDTYMVMGMRWIILQALRLMAEEGVRRPLIINLSLGALAGPGDGTGFVERWIAADIAAFRIMSGNVPIRIVAAYGNSRRSRLVARSNLAAKRALDLDLRVQPDDRTFSFLELRVPKGRHTGMKVAVDLPSGGFPSLPFRVFPSTGQAVFLGTGGVAPVAGVLGLKEDNHDLVLIAIAPTMRDDARPAAPPGVWRITVQNDSTSPVHISAKVRRDDTPAGYRPAGRQSWIDSADGWTWDDETKDWMRPANSSPVKRSGTAVGYSGPVDKDIYFVGALEAAAGGIGWRPARYTSEGGGELGALPGPRLSVPVDLKHTLPGRMGTTLQSGGTLRLSGTSAAAPLVVRAIVTGIMDGSLVLGDMPSNVTADDELAVLLGLDRPADIKATRDARRGYGILAKEANAGAQPY